MKALAVVTVLFGVLLGADRASAQIVAAGKSLTVTTANAFARFDGLDLVEFKNSVTNETYLKKPSTGGLAQVSTMTPVGGALQQSDWTIGAEPGTGLPLATITTQDSARALTLKVKVDPATQEIVLRVSASVTSGGLRNVSWSIAGLDFAGGRLILPAYTGEVLDLSHPGVDESFQYPNTWNAQMAVYETPHGSFILYSTDTQMSSKQLRVSTRGDSTVDVGVGTEAVGPYASATTVPDVEWRLKAFAGDWRVSAQTYRNWLAVNRPPVSNAAHPWVSNIRSVVNLYEFNFDPSILARLAAMVVPSETLLYLVNWRQASYDVNYPDYTPRDDVAGFVAAAHALGFKVMLHVDLIGVSQGNPDYAAMQAFQLRNPGTLALQGWQWDDQPPTTTRFAIINPAASAFRALFLARVGAAVAALGPDALHLDFSVALFNDGNGLIEGQNFAQGSAQLHRDLIAAFPALALGGEGENDILYRYHSWAQAWFFGEGAVAPGHPIEAFLFSPQVQYYGHLGQPVALNPDFRTYLPRLERRAIVPRIGAFSMNDLDTTNAENARLLGIVQSWQNHAFQPDWNADWTGALVKYQGLAGSTAALTDSGTLMTLTADGSTLFQLAHDTSQVTSARFIPSWLAFDAGHLYGLDPARQYFLDDTPRPTTTHITSLPAGVTVGPGTLVTPAFAHVELAPLVLPSFDFDSGLVAARNGVSYQGTDAPLGNGAFAGRGTITAGGVTRTGISLQPPNQGPPGGETFVEYAVPIPVGALMKFSVGVADSGSCSDGVTFRVTVNGVERWRQHVTQGWQDAFVNLAAYGGSQVSLRLISNPGPASDPNCDRSLWSQLSVGAVSTAAVSVPLSLESGSVIAGFDGDGVLSAGPLSPTAMGVRVPGAFTIFTQPGTLVSPGTNLANLPFQVWGRPHGEMSSPGGIFGAGAVVGVTSGGVPKSPTIWAHPPNEGATRLSWVLQLPANPLRLGLSVGLGDGAMSFDGVDFQVWINGVPYWHLTTQADQWLSGELDLSRWKGQNVLVELVTDSRTNFNADWAYWADLVLSASQAMCVYGAPAAASSGAFGGSFSASVTAPATCPWSAVSSVPWLTVVSGSGNGNGTVDYLVALNPDSAARTGTVTIGGQVLTVTQAGLAPTITAIPNQATNAGAPTKAIPFTVDDVDTPVTSLTVSGSSSNAALVPDANITFGGSGANRTVTVTPAVGQIGTTTITVTVSDGTGSSSASFLLTVTTASDVPLMGDMDGDGKADLIVWRPGNGTFYWLTSSTGYSYASAGSKTWGAGSQNDVPLVADIDGDHRADLIVWRPGTGTFFWLTSSSGYSYAAAGSKQWGAGALSDVPLVADMDGDGRADLIVWRPGSGTFYWLTSSSGYGYGSAGSRQWGSGALKDVPLVADVDGDGKADLAVWRPGTGTFFWLTSSSGYSYLSAGSKPWGAEALSDVPRLADMDGDGRADLIIWRPGSGTFFWLTSSSGYNYASAGSKPWGAANDMPLLAEMDGDGRADVIVWRPSNGTFYWLMSSTGFDYARAGSKVWGTGG